MSRERYRVRIYGRRPWWPLYGRPVADFLVTGDEAGWREAAEKTKDACSADTPRDYLVRITSEWEDGDD